MEIRYIFSIPFNWINPIFTDYTNTIIEILCLNLIKSFINTIFKVTFKHYEELISTPKREPMNYKNARVIITLIFLITFQVNSFSQKVIGFFPNWRSGGEENNIQYNKLTDIIYCFIQPNASGQFPAFNTWSSTDQSKFNTIKTKAKAAGCRIRISSGGAGSAGLYSPIAANATYRSNFAQTVADFIVANDIDGFDVDWEFPSTSEKGNLDLLLSAFRTAFNAKETAGYRHIYLGVDVGGESGHLSYFTTTFVNYIDEVNIMAYDLAGGFSTVSLSKNSFDIWKNYLGAANANKLVLGVPFYTAGGGSMYSQIASPYSSNASDAYNGLLAGSDGSTYNAYPALKQKTDYVMTNGGGGIMIWEITQDILTAAYYQYSLLSAVDVSIQPYKVSCSTPNLGPDGTLCGSGSLTLNSSLSSQSFRTFTWYKDGSVTGSNTPTLTNVTAGGKYWVKVDSSGKCSKTDTITISSTLPTVNLGPDATLCSSTSMTLDAGVTGTGLTFAWTKDGTAISGASSSTYTATAAGTYGVTVSASGCTSKSDQVVINSSLLTVSGTTTICSGSSTNLTVTSSGGPFNWYTTQGTGGSPFFTGTTYAASPTSTTTYYVQNGAGTSGSVGGTGNFGTIVWGDPTNHGMTFSTNVSNVTIKSVDFYVGAWATVTNSVIAIKNSSGTELGASALVGLDNQSATANKVTVNLNIVIPNAGTGYVIYFKTCGSPGSAGYQSTPGSFPMSDGTNTISFTAGPQIFNNLQFVAGSACARTPVKVTVNTSCSTPPTITFSDVTKTYGASPFTMAASSNSSGALTYSITSGSSFASINSTTGQVTILGAGTATVQVSQAASGGYSAATKTATLTINKAALTAKADDKSRVYNTANPTFTITYTGFVNGETASVLTSAPTASTTATTASNVGTYPISLTGGSAANYTITLTAGTLTITKATPTLSYTGPTSGTVGTSLTLAATTNSTATPSYSVSNGTGSATLSGSSLTLNSAGTVTLTISVAATTNYNAASITQTITINSLTTPTITFNDVSKTYGDAPFTMAATSNSSGALTYSITSGSSFASISSTTGQVTILGAGTVTVQVSQAASGPYGSIVKTATLTINKATPTVTYTGPTSGVAGTNLNLSATTNSPVSPTFTVSNGTGTATILGSTLSLTTTGTVTVTVIVSANANFNAAYVNQEITITSAGTPTVTIDFPTSGQTGETIALGVTTNSKGTVTYSVSNGTGTAILNGNQLTLTSAGTVTVTVHIAADGAYEETTVSQTITISNVTAVLSSSESGFKVLPSITESDATLEFQNVSIKKGVILITDSKGVPVTSINYNGETEINLSSGSWSAGMYVIQLIGETGTTITKLIKQ